MRHHITIIALTLLLTSSLPAETTTRSATTCPISPKMLPDDPEFRQALTKLQDMLKKSLPEGWELVSREGLCRPLGWPEGKGVQITLRPKGGPTKKKPLRSMYIMVPGYDGARALSRHYHWQGRETMRWRGRRVITFRWPTPWNAGWKERLPDIRRALRQTNTLKFSPADLPNVLSVKVRYFNSRAGRLKCYITPECTNWKPRVVSIAARVVEVTTFDGRTVLVRKPFKHMEITLNDIVQGWAYMLLDKKATGVSQLEVQSVRLEYHAVIAGKSEKLRVGPIKPGNIYRVNAPVRLDIETSRIPKPSGDLLRARITLHRNKQDARIAKGREIGQSTYLSQRNICPLKGIQKRTEALRESGDKRVETVFFRMDLFKPDQPTHISVTVPCQLSTIRGTANILLLPCPRPLVDPAFGTRPEQLSREEIQKLVFAATGERRDLKAVQRLIELGKPAIAPLVRTLGMDGHGIEVGNASNILARIGTPAVPALIQAIKDGVGRHGGTPARVLAEIGDLRAVNPIIEALKSDYKEPPPRGMWWALGGRHAYAASALGCLADPRAVDCLKDALLSDSANVRSNAAWALGKIGDLKAVASLQRLTNDKATPSGRLTVGGKAREALQNIRMFGPATLPATEPATQPGVPGADRVKKLKAHPGTFYLELDWEPGSQPPCVGHTWILTTKPLPEYMPQGDEFFFLSWHVPGKPLVPSGRSTVRISEKLAGRIIDYLARDGFFARAKTAKGQITLKADKPTTVLLTGTSGHDYLCYEVLDKARAKKLSAFVHRTFTEATAVRDAKLSTAREVLVRKAIALRPRNRRADLKSDQNSTGLDFSDVLKWSGQKSFVERFTKAPKPYDDKIDELKIDSYTEQTHVWALCALLDHSNIDVKIRVVRVLAANPCVLADAVPALLAAAKSNNYPVEGSENATLHMTYRGTLKKALEKITREALTPKGLKVITYPKPGKPKTIRSEDNPRYFAEQVDFKKVEIWLGDVFLSWSLGVTRELERWGKGRKCYLDLDTGKVFTEPEGLADEKTRRAWCTRMGIDLVCDRKNIARCPVLVGVNLQVTGGLYRKDATCERWWDLRASRARALLAKADPPGHPILTWQSYVFKTREGRVGQLQFLAATDKKLKLRFRLVCPKTTTTKPATQPPAREE